MARRPPVEIPRGLKPLGVSREVAAALIGVSVPLFENMVAAGRLPKPIRYGSRKVWCARAIEEYFHAEAGYTPPVPKDPLDDWADYK